MDKKLEDMNLVGASEEAMLEHIWRCHDELRRLRQLLDEKEEEE